VTWIRTKKVDFVDPRCNIARILMRLLDECNSRSIYAGPGFGRVGSGAAGSSAKTVSLGFADAENHDIDMQAALSREVRACPVDVPEAVA
jgi:hypothetical protein